MSCWLIVYGSGGVVGDDNGGNSDMGGGMSSGNLSESTNPVLDSLSNSYSNSDIFLCKG